MSRENRRGERRRDGEKPSFRPDGGRGGRSGTDKGSGSGRRERRSSEGPFRRGREDGRLPGRDGRWSASSGKHEREDPPVRGETGKKPGGLFPPAAREPARGAPEESGTTPQRAFRGPASRGEPALFDVLILGAGASGLMCAAALAARGLSTALVDRARSPGRKLALCGGGRANFTNRHMDTGAYVTGRPDFVEAVLSAVTCADILRVVEGLGLPWEEREGGRIFLGTPAPELVRALARRCRRGGASLFLEERFGPESLSFPGQEARLETASGLVCRARNLVLALGSPACPASGATGLGYALARSLGHGLVKPRAALTPLLLPPDSGFPALSGMSLPVRIGCGDWETEDDLLFTRTGLSGPAALKASLRWQEGLEIVLDFLPKGPALPFSDEAAGAKTPRQALAGRLPQRLADLLTEGAGARRHCAELSRGEREALTGRVHSFRLVPAGLAGLRHAEVCLGGVDCAEVEPLTFRSRKNPLVRIIGEMLDVTGELGGFNLHWAFASALLAARALAG